MRRSFLLISAISIFFGLSILAEQTAAAQPKGDALGTCDFVCDDFSSASTGMKRLTWTSPYGFDFSSNYDIEVALDSNNPGWGNFVFLRGSTSSILFPGSVEVSFAILRVRNAGGQDWQIWGEAGGTQTTDIVQVPASQGNPTPLLLCAYPGETFTTLGISNPSGEPQIFEICVPARDSACSF